MESAKRGYIATGDETFLRPYLEGTKRFDSEFQALNQLVDDSPSQQQRLKDIYAGYEDAEAYDSRIIALRRAGKADPTLIENRLRKQQDGYSSRADRGVSKPWKKGCVSSAFRPRTGDGS